MMSSLADAALFDKWMHDNAILAESTMFMYFNLVKHFLATNPNLEVIEDYNNFLIEHSIKKRGVMYYFAMKLFIDYKFTKKETKERLTEGLLKIPQRNDYRREHKYLEEEKILEVLNFISDERHRVIALIQMITGIRASDAMRIKSDGVAIDTYNGRQTLRINLIGKGRKRHVVYIHDDIAQQVVMNYIKDKAIFYEDYIFLRNTNDKNKSMMRIKEFNDVLRVNYNRYLMDLKSALMSAGVDTKLFATHDFRRCLARRTWDAYKDINILQKILNHSDPATSLRYLQYSGLDTVDYQYRIQMGKDLD